MVKADKAAAVADIAEQFKEASATLVTEYRGLTVANLKDLRRSLGDSAIYTVAKNTMIKRAAAEAGIEGLDELFVGPTAIAFSQDPIAAPKAAVGYAKRNEKLAIIGGALGSSLLSAEQVRALADLPSIDELRAKLVGLLASPAARLVGLLQAPGAQLARVLAAHADQS